MIRALFFIMFLGAGSAFAGALPAYDITAGAGSFSATQGIIPGATPYTFSITASNDAVVASRTIPVAANTPYGPATGSFKLAGIISKPAISALASGLLKAVPLISVGSAIYDAFQAAKISQNSAGGYDISIAPPQNPDGTYPSIVIQHWVNSHNNQIFSSQQACFYAVVAMFPGATPTSNDCPQTGNTYACATGGTLINNISCSYANPSAAFPPSPATPAQVQGALDNFVNASNLNALRMAREANTAGVLVPAVPVDPAQSPAPAPLVSPWMTTNTSIDPATGSVTQTQKQAQIDIQPALDTASPSPVKISELTRTIVNNVTTNNTTTTVNNSQQGYTPSASVQTQNSNANPAPAPDPCLANPDRMGCINEGVMPAADVIKEKTLDFSTFAFNTFSFSGVSACPADRVVRLGVVFHYKPICDFMTIFHFGALAFGFFIAGLIMVGQRQSATD